MKISKMIIAIAIMLLITVTSCTHTRNGQIVMDDQGNFYELSNENMLSMPAEAYRLHPIDTNKFAVRGFDKISK